MKATLKHVGVVFAKSFTKEVLIAIAFAFITIMLTIGAPGQEGLTFMGLEAVFYGDTIGAEILAGNTFESQLAAGTVDDQLQSDLQFFLVKALISLVVFIILVYVIFMLTESATWNLFHKRFSVAGFVLRLKLNIVLFFIALAFGFFSLVLYVGFQYFKIISILAGLIAFLSFVFAVSISFFIVHMFYVTNMLASQKKTIRTILETFWTFNWRRLFVLVPIYAAVFLVMVVLATLGVQLNSMWPNAYGLISILTLIIPLSWLRQLLYNDWKLKE